MNILRDDERIAKELEDLRKVCAELSSRVAILESRDRHSAGLKRDQNALYGPIPSGSLTPELDVDAQSGM